MNCRYDYDSLGRLTEVRLNSAVVESYTYGANGARSLETNTRRDITDRSYAYDAEDHLLTAGDLNFSHDIDSYLTSVTDAATLETTTYQYSSRGELQQVDLPDGRIVTYSHDPMGRRVAKYN